MSLPVANAEVCARRAAARGLRVREPLGITEWSGRYRMLSQKEASEYGRFDVERIPYLRGIMDALDERHPAREVIMDKSAQTGGTTVGQNWVGWTIHQSPASMMILTPTEDMGLRWARSKLHPMIAETPVLRAILPPGRRAEDVTMQEKHFPGGVLYFASANNPKHMTMVACRRLLLDEVDRFPRDIDGEGDPVELVKNRFSTYQGRSKIFEISTPTDEGSRIDADYQRSSKGRYFVPCPDCGAMQALRWANIQYPEGQPEKACYRCDECAALIEEHHKTWMLSKGEWRHEKPELCDSVIGFHISCLYTPIGLGDTWPKHAREYERVKKDPAKLRVFQNTRLGEVHRSDSVRVDWEDVKQRGEDYPLRTIPPGVLLLTCGGDIQHDRAEVQILGWSRDERITVIDYHVIPGEPVGNELWQRLDEYLAGEIMNAFGVPMRLACSMIDAGNWQQEVTNFTRRLRQRNVFASKGATTTTRPAIGKPTHVEVRHRGKADKRGAELYMLGPHILKNTLFGRLRSDHSTKERLVLPADRLIRFSNQLPESYFEQLTAEAYDPIKGRWVPVRERNEALDTMIYGIAAALHHSVAVHRMRELDWQRLEQLYERAGTPAARVEPKLGTEPVPRKSGGFLPTVAITTKGPE